MQVAFFGSSLVSAYWNGAATYYRGIVRAMHERGHLITFFEPDAWKRQENRDIPNPDWAEVVVYDATEESAAGALKQARGADLVVKASGVGVLDEFLEAAVLELKRSSNMVVFWDVDAPATLDRLMENTKDPFLKLVPEYDSVFTYGGGQPVVQAYKRFGARHCQPIYNALDPHTHFPVPIDSRFECDLAFLGNRLPDREARVEEFFLRPAARMPERNFILGGSGWGDKSKTKNIVYHDHVFTRDHNAFNSTPLAVLNVTRDSMARYGFSPATRVFEAAGAAACLITDKWEGIEYFFEPGKEILVANDGDHITDLLGSLGRSEAREVGESAYKRVRAEHTYAHRVAELDSILDILSPNSVRVAV